jgi:hypothetical protein
MSHTVFFAFYEDRAKVNAAVDAEGNEESAHDIADRRECRERKEFAKLDDAVEWARKAVADEKTFYGQAEVQEYLVLPRSQWCKHCVCRGDKQVRYHIVDETGILESHDNDDTCEN